MCQYVAQYTIFGHLCQGSRGTYIVSTRWGSGKMGEKAGEGNVL